MSKMFSGLDISGTVDLNILDEGGSIQQTCVLELKNCIRDAKNGACPMHVAETANILWGGGSRILLHIHILPILPMSS